MRKILFAVALIALPLFAQQVQPPGGGGGGGSGTVASVSVTTANGVSGTVATATTTPAITLTLGAITPTSVAATGTVGSGTGSGAAGAFSGVQGTVPGSFPANSFSLYAPTSIAIAYQWVAPSAAATGFILGTNTGGVVALTQVSSIGSGSVVLETSGNLANTKIRSLGASFTNAGSAIAAGPVSYFTVPYACTISAWNITLSPADTATFDIWKIATGTAIPTVSNTITASALPAISTGTAIHSTTLTGWTTAVAANDIFGIKLSASGGVATQATINVECDQS